MHAGVNNEVASDLSLRLVDQAIGVAKVSTNRARILTREQRRCGNLEAVAIVRQHLLQKPLGMIQFVFATTLKES
jgi:hypothetical protein